MHRLIRRTIQGLALPDPAPGYYEWNNEAGGTQPYYFTCADGEPMTFAGLWDEWKDRASGEKLKSCTMIVTEPNALADGDT